MRKRLLAMDTATGDVCAVEFTLSQQGDSPVLPDLLAQIPAEQPIGTVTADGARDARKGHSAIIGRGGTAFGPSFGPMAVRPSLPIRRNSRP